jgi:hypothetical protein
MTPEHLANVLWLEIWPWGPESEVRSEVKDYTHFEEPEVSDEEV